MRQSFDCGADFHAMRHVGSAATIGIGVSHSG
jgi:hypothetical protein